MRGAERMILREPNRFRISQLEKAPTVLQKRFRQKRGRPNSPLLDRIWLVFLAFTDLDGFITFTLD